MQDPRIPQPVRDVLEALERAGHEAALAGRCVRELVLGSAPSDFEATVRGEPAALLALFPRAVVTAPHAARLTLPTAAGPLELDPLPAADTLEEHLGRRDFTIHAIAYRLPRPGSASDGWVDPHAGRRDLAARYLRCPGAAKERLDEDPVRSLRAARLVAELDLEIDPDLEDAMRGAAPALRRCIPRRRRSELDRLLVAPHAERGLGLLRRTGLERAVAPDAGEDVPAVVGALPPVLELRWAAWLRGTRARAILRELRCPRDRALRIEHLLQQHPIDRGTASAREARARRLAGRDDGLPGNLVALREAELAARGETSTRLDHLRRSLERARDARRAATLRAGLALDGREVMEHLRCEPGARVGRALSFLARQVAEDPARNEPDTLRALLDAWAGDGAGG